MNIAEANQIFRRSIIRGFFEPRLADLDFKKSLVLHPKIPDGGMTKRSLLHIFFDVQTGSDYPDGDEWFILDMLFPHDIQMPDAIKGPEYFTTIPAGDATYWHHRELVRYKYGKSKKLSESINFLVSKYDKLCVMLEPLEAEIN